MKRIVLIDGEHYPDVTRWAIQKLGNVCCAVFLGGTEKIGSLRALEDRIGVPLYHSPNYLDALKRAILENDVEEVVDLSDEPVLTYEDRFRIASLCMLFGVTYRGADFMFTPKPLKKTKKPSISIIGTGKRVGKTAVSGFVARTLKEVARPVIVTMGRGGPEEPELIDGEKIEITPQFLIKVAEEGKHAASDHFEDALTSRVTLAENLPHDLIILEGSGATFPAYRADAYILIIGGRQKTDFLRGYFGPFRIALADLIIVTMSDEISPEKRKEIRKIVEEINPKADLHFTAFCPRPLGNISGKRLGLIMTSQSALPKAKEQLEKLGAEVVATSGNLSNRPKLRADLENFSGIDAVAVELKAAAVDVVTKWALERGIEVIYLDNEPVNIDGKGLRKSVLKLGKRVLGRRA
ncbi:MAG: cyclic 2,3-diphosphoglycerate synthase [Thermococcaceae archaeon]|nr:cyclic 2,3-diphosphoglycerate synthase [Thermococcaceae archaeon]